MTTNVPTHPGSLHWAGRVGPSRFWKGLNWANGSVGKKKGGDTTTRTEIETAGSGKDLGFWLWPLGAGR
eukprot:scaffold105946_cov47-Phaeocystis_antarctica.AAC.1